MRHGEKFGYVYTIDITSQQIHIEPGKTQLPRDSGLLCEVVMPYRGMPFQNTTNDLSELAHRTQPPTRTNNLAIAPLSGARSDRRGLSGAGKPLQTAHVWPQSVWNIDAAVRLLVIFQNRDQRAADRETGTIERVH